MGKMGLLEFIHSIYMVEDKYINKEIIIEEAEICKVELEKKETHGITISI